MSRTVNQELATAAARNFDAALSRGRQQNKQGWIENYAVLARANGYDFGRGDIAIVNSVDVPKSFMLVRGIDPVWVNDRMCEPSKCLFVASKLKSLPLYAGLNG